MPFHFTLESLLRLRRAQHRQQELRLQTVVTKAAGVLREIENLAAEAAQLAATRTGEKTVSSAEIHFNRTQRTVIEQRSYEAKVRLQKLREQQTAIATELRKTWQHRETLEALLRGEFAAYELEQNRRGQAEQDDLYVSRQRSAQASLKRQILPS